MTRIIYSLLFMLLIVPTAAADCEPGDFLGYFTGNDDVATVNAALGIDASLLGKVDDPPGADGTFTLNVSEFGEVNPLTLLPQDPIAGTWSWTGTTPVNLLTMKANGGFAAYCILPPCEELPEYDTITQSGTWDTRLHLGGQGLSHASVWSVDCVNAPEPSTLMLVGIGIAGLMIWRKP